MPETTTAELKVETWERINERKQPNDSVDDVVRRLLDTTEEVESLCERLDS